MIQPPCLLARLPHELILYQLAFFPDLRSHLAFSYTCRRIHALYDENLWRRITILSGLGKPLDVASGRVSWRGVCEAAVAHGRVCRLHDCSEVALSRGQDRGLIAPPSNLVFDHGSIYAQDVELHLSRVFEGLTGDLEDLYSSTIPCSSIPRPWRFKQLFQEAKRSDLLESFALPATHASDEMVTKLAHHFPASCALATSPAVDRLYLDMGPHMVYVRNKDGVCVWDVVSAIGRKMVEVDPSTVTGSDKAPMRIYEIIAREWQQYVLLRLSLHGRGSINGHVDIGEEFFVSMDSAPP